MILFSVVALIYTFSNCINLDNVSITSNVNYIGENAFSGCSNLKNITMPSNIIKIIDDAFDDYSILPDNTEYIFKSYDYYYED